MQMICSQGFRTRPALRKPAWATSVPDHEARSCSYRSLAQLSIRVPAVRFERDPRAAIVLRLVNVRAGSTCEALNLSKSSPQCPKERTSLQRGATYGEVAHVLQSHFRNTRMVIRAM